jgi:hypothetical protein
MMIGLCLVLNEEVVTQMIYIFCYAQDRTGVNCVLKASGVLSEVEAQGHIMRGVADRLPQANYRLDAAAKPVTMVLPL